MKRYNPKEIEPKWQQKWADSGVYEAEDNSDKPKKYILEYFPYPSGVAMHVGHVRNYAIGDVLARHSRMSGYNVLHPMGWDAFGLPAENYAIKTGISPQQAVAQNVERFKAQLNQMGLGYDWSCEINSTDPDYYRWTQWFFLLLHKRGLAYRKESTQWWCPVDKTVLANEQVENGQCWRCGSMVEKKALPQWFFKITDYADRLAKDLDEVDWTDSIKNMQRNWIGRSTGAEIHFALHKVVTPNPDMARTYIMGQKNITKADIEAIGGSVASVTDSGYLCVELPVARAQDFEELINQKMEPGFWNEYLANDQVVFIFKHKNGDLERFVLDDANAYDICKLGNQFNNQPEPDATETPWSWLAGNKWYAPIVPKLKVFTTRPDTIFGATFMVIAPEHPLVEKITADEQREEVNSYIKQTQAKSDVERQETDREKTGVFTGAYAINPANNDKIPIWTADYVLAGYGTGAIMAVPAHDERDHAFAKKFDLPIVPVVTPIFREYNREATDRPSAVVIARDPENDTYCAMEWTKMYVGDWCWPGGGLDEGESIADGAAREFREETGYTDFVIDAVLPAATSIYYDRSKKNDNPAFPLQRSVRHIVLATLKSHANDGQAGEDYEKEAFKIHWISKTEALERMREDWRAQAEYAFDGAIHIGEGAMINSGSYNNLRTEDVREKIVVDLTAKGVAKIRTNYKIRDWLISRQRYWGAPIPIIHCPKDGAVPVPEDQLPVVLPEMESYEPSGDGRSPLARVPEFVNTTCPRCGGSATRETDTMDGFACSSWYFLRYADPHNNSRAFDADKVKHWLPVDDYVGGAEHAVMHLLYARMWTKVMQDEGLINFGEPFKTLRNHGMILAPDGQKMSKSKGNTIEPDVLIDQGYGADAIRIMELFIGPWNQAANWNVEGMGGSFRFLQRVWTLAQEYNEAGESVGQTDDTQLKRIMHRAIYRVSKDLDEMGFNTAIAALMETVNELYKIKAAAPITKTDSWEWAVKTLLQLLAPFAPHITEELWSQLGQNGSVHTSQWPKHDERYLRQDTLTIVVQVNGKVRAQLEVGADAEKDAIIALAKTHERVTPHLEGKELKKAIYVPGKLVSLVV